MTQLLRWIFDKPLYVKPPIGNPPSFLSDGDKVTLGTTSLYKRCVDALKNGKSYARGAFDEYCSTFVSHLERFRLSTSEIERFVLSNPKGEFDDVVIQSIESFVPYRNEMLQVVNTIAQYVPNIEFAQRLHRFFEDLIPYMDRIEGMRSWNEWDFDNYKFIIHEIFLHTLSVLLQYELFEFVDVLLGKQYYVHNIFEDKDIIVNFDFIQQSMQSLEHRKRRINSNKYSLRADLLHDRCDGSGVKFRHLMQADFVAFLRSEMSVGNTWYSWWPETLIYLGYSRSPFEIFAKSSSKAYFDKMKIALGISDVKDLEDLLASYQSNKKHLPQWGFKSIDPSMLLGYEHFATRP